MKTKLLLTLTTICAILLLQTTNVYSQCVCGSPTNLTVEWAYSYGGTLDDIAYKQIPVDDDNDGRKDDGYVVVGSTQTTTGNALDAYVIKLFSDGTVDWTYQFDASTKNDVAYSVEETHDGYLLICGSSQNDHFSTGVYSIDVWVVKLDLNGSVVSGWTTTWNSVTRDGKFYGSTCGSCTDIGYDIKEDGKAMVMFHQVHKVQTMETCGSLN